MYAKSKAVTTKIPAETIITINPVKIPKALVIGFAYCLALDIFSSVTGVYP